MSLILDALRRADAERERGAVPGLHSMQVPPISLEATAPRRLRPWIWAAIGIVGTLLAAFAIYLFFREAPLPSVESARRMPPATPAATSPAPAAATIPATTEPPITQPREIHQVAEPARWPSAEPRSESRKSAEPPAATAAAASAAAPATVTAPPEAPVVAREQLPDHIRAGLPQLSVGGSIYSADPASRSVIINGRLYRENDRLTQDLSLEQIKLKAAVLRYKGYRFELQF